MLETKLSSNATFDIYGVHLYAEITNIADSSESRLSITNRFKNSGH